MVYVNRKTSSRTERDRLSPSPPPLSHHGSAFTHRRVLRYAEMHAAALETLCHGIPRRAVAYMVCLCMYVNVESKE